MPRFTRRHILEGAIAIGASPAFAAKRARPSRQKWTERREIFPQGVASGDPEDDSVILWTRRPYPKGTGPSLLTVEVSEDQEFRKVVVESPAPVSEEADWTCRVLVGNLRPRTVYASVFATDDAGAEEAVTTMFAGRPGTFMAVSSLTRMPQE